MQHSNILERFFLLVSPKYREEQQRAQELAQWRKQVQNSYIRNEILLKSIVKNCPQGEILLLKFSCGTSHQEEIDARIPNLLKRVLKNGFMEYESSCGLMAIIPEKYHRNPVYIAQASMNCSPAFEGREIQEWTYVKI